MNHTRQETRANTWKHAIRKRKIARAVYHSDKDYYDNLHQYSKNKIHCPYPLFRQKNGDNSVEQRKVSERRKINYMEDQVNEISEKEQ